MAKITSKASLTLGTNVKLHLVDKQGTDIAISVAGAVITVTSSSTSFTASSETVGIVKRAIAVGDVIQLYRTGTVNEGVEATVTAVSANSITATTVTGSPVNQAAAANINIQARAKSYQVLAAGGLSFIDGVQGIVLGSWLVDLWFTNDLDKYPPVFTSIEPRAKSLASINGWEPHDLSTLNAIRDTALEIRPTATAAATKIYPLLRSNNLHATTDQMKFWASGDPAMTAPTNAVMTGYINQLVLIYDSVNAIDKRGNWYTRCAEAGKTIIMEASNLQYAEIYPVSANNAIDPKLADGTGTPLVSDGTIGAGGIYANIVYRSDVDGIYSGDVNGSPFNFYGYIDGDTKTNEQVHAKINYLWRQSANINADGAGASMRGDKQPPMSTFSGDEFTVQTYLLNYLPAQRNNLRVVDTGGTKRSWPSILTITVNGAALAVGGVFSIFHRSTHGGSSAVYFKNEANVDQKDITISSSQGIVMSYSTYSTGGHTPNTPLDLRLTFNRPGFIEPDYVDFTAAGSNLSVNIQPKADPSYTAA